MNLWQILKEAQAKLRSLTWDDGTKVFQSQSVLTTVFAPARGIASIVPPYAIFSPQSATMDPEYGQEPGYLEQGVDLRLAVVIPGDPYGEHALMGANIQTTGLGKGLLELEEKVLAALGLLNEVEGVSLQLRFQSAPGADTDQDSNYVIWRTYSLIVTCTVEKTYLEAGSLFASETAGTVTLSWALPARLDVDHVTLRRGATAPATIADGSGVTLSGDLALTVDDTPGVGTWHYALFVVYDDTSVSVPRRVSVTIAP